MQDTQPAHPSRYHRQSLLPQIGEEGQGKLAAARVLIIGCGALGTVVADQLARAGTGHLRIADRDIVELTNLQRQVLFDEEDARRELPKAIAAARRLGKVNSSITIESLVVDVHPQNIEELMAGVDLVIDGTDNVETRYLINDAAVKLNQPWIYGACVGMEGRAMAIVPGQTPCLGCIFPEPPGAGELPTCDTAGVLGAASAIVGAYQSALAIRLLVAGATQVASELLVIDVWQGRFKTLATKDARREDCPACALRRFGYLNARREGAVSLCGRNAVQVRAAPGTGLDLAAMTDRLASAGRTQQTAWFVRCRLDDPKDVSLTVFADGRVLIHGVTDLGRARSIAARYVGS